MVSKMNSSISSPISC